MRPTSLLLKAYYERLHDGMVAAREGLLVRMDALLSAEMAEQGFGPLSPDKVQAYREACQAFVDERIETYNPVGIQYTFDRGGSREAAELEFQLDWYDSRREFETLVAAARALADAEIPDARLPELADKLIHRVGAFPDASILAGYAAGPTLQKLPDFIVASAIEELICRRPTG